LNRGISVSLVGSADETIDIGEQFLKEVAEVTHVNCVCLETVDEYKQVAILLFRMAQVIFMRSDLI